MAEANDPKMVQNYEIFFFPTSELLKNTTKLTQNIKNREVPPDFNFSPELELYNFLSYSDTRKGAYQYPHRD